MLARWPGVAAVVRGGQTHGILALRPPRARPPRRVLGGIAPPAGGHTAPARGTGVRWLAGLVAAAWNYETKILGFGTR
jgi:hypothetical protein